MSKVRTLDEFVERENAAENRELQFTGNWFIDAGILGFVNLMEEVYGWDLEELREFILSSTDDQIYSVFAYAFWYKVISDTTKRWLEKDLFKKGELKKGGIDPQELIKNIEKNIFNEIHRINESLRASVVEEKSSPEEAILSLNESVKSLIYDKFSEYEPYLKKVFAQNKKTIVTHSASIGIIGYLDFFTNLSIFNPSSNKSGKEKDVLSLFNKLVMEGFIRKDKKIKDLPVNVLDKSLSPFIYSASDFPNAYYGSPMTLKTLEEMAIVSPAVYILCIPFSFVWIRGRNYLFYSPNLEFSYHVNKKLRKYIEDVTNQQRSIFELTWNAVIDTLIELKSIISLENMYILEFSGIINQQLQNVEYIGIPKLQASIVIDDTLRNALNKYIPIRESKGEIERVWILEEFIKNKSVLPYLIYHTHLTLAGKIDRKHYAGVKSLIYASIVDAKIREFGKSNRLFEEDFFERYRGILTEIKEDAHWAFGISRIFKDLFEDFDERKSYANILLSMIKRSDKYRIVNTLLKTLIDKKADIKNVKSLVNFVFNKILPNDRSWKNYALVFVIGLIGGGDADGDE